MKKQEGLLGNLEWGRAAVVVFCMYRFVVEYK